MEALLSNRKASTYMKTEAKIKKEGEKELGEKIDYVPHKHTKL